MKKFKKIILTAAVYYNIFITKTMAAVGEGACSPSNWNPLKNCYVNDLIVSIANLIMKIGIPVAGIFIIYSGLQFVMARGNEEKIKEAKKSFGWAMIGTAVLLGANVIARAIAETIQGF